MFFHLQCVERRRRLLYGPTCVVIFWTTVDYVERSSHKFFMKKKWVSDYVYPSILNFFGFHKTQKSGSESKKLAHPPVRLAGYSKIHECYCKVTQVTYYRRDYLIKAYCWSPVQDSPCLAGSKSRPHPSVRSAKRVRTRMSGWISSICPSINYVLIVQLALRN